MNAPTLYFLTVTERWSASEENRLYEVWEQHKGQCKGCVKSQPEFVELCHTKAEVKKLIGDWKVNPPLNGVLESVEWEPVDGIDSIEDVLDIDAHGVYHNLEEMLMAISELNGLKPYKIINESGNFAGYTFEVVE